MPLVRIDALAGRSENEIKTLLDAAHRAMLSAFKVPERDRYQVYHEHPPAHLIVEDTGLGIRRTENVVVVTVTSRPRSQEAKLEFYKTLCRELKESCGIEPSDVMVSIVINSDADWSFGNGRAQFVTGEL
jgi:Tautomerase enzyme